VPVDAARRRVAVITADVLSDQMAGPAIRAYHIAEQLATAHSVTLISTARCTIEHDGFACRYAPWGALEQVVGAAEVVVLQGFVSYHAPWLVRGEKILVIDLYDPINLEQLEQLRDRPATDRHATLDVTVRVLNEQLVRGDFFICASEEQRHFWLGQLSALGRLNPENYDRDPSMHSLITVCPFGLPSRPPTAEHPAIKGVAPGITHADKVILWAGGIYNWFDPLTLLRALHRLEAAHTDLRLYFLGMKHPNPDVPAMRMAGAARALAAELGLVGRSVYFNEGWVDYADRQNYLLDADVGVSTHFEQLETTFSFRTRILDYLWAGMPVVTTGGDSFGALVAAEGLGVTVAERDVDGLAAALERTVYDSNFVAACRANVERVRRRFVWEQSLQPLSEFCAAPARAADAGTDTRRIARRPLPPASRTGRDAARAWALWREGGAPLVVARATSRLRRRRGEHADGG
jgi:glycosyltransferase involved in cell wall biosynthesis